MEQNEEINKLTYKEMQEFLPDYVFDRISQEDKAKFEEQLPLYPDLQDEIKQVRAVFSKIENMDLDKVISSRTRNLSVKVNERLERKNNRSRKFSLVNRYLVPTFGLALLLIIIFSSKDLFKFSNNGKNKIDSNSSNELQILKNSDALALLDSSSTLDSLVEATSNLVNPVHHVSAKETPVDDATIDKIWSDFLSDNLIIGGILPQNFLIYNHITSNGDLMKDLNDMDENDFQNILKEIDDVDFNS
ncbi:MAG: hypothetical protein ABSG15_15680 [FCB group bacterium]|jgi:hypothetical protein